MAFFPSGPREYYKPGPGMHEYIKQTPNFLDRETMQTTPSDAYHYPEAFNMTSYFASQPECFASIPTGYERNTMQHAAPGAYPISDFETAFYPPVPQQFIAAPSAGYEHNIMPMAPYEAYPISQYQKPTYGPPQPQFTTPSSVGYASNMSANQMAVYRPSQPQFAAQTPVGYEHNNMSANQMAAYRHLVPQMPPPPSMAMVRPSSRTTNHMTGNALAAYLHMQPQFISASPGRHRPAPPPPVQFTQPGQEYLSDSDLLARFFPVEEFVETPQSNIITLPNTPSPAPFSTPSAGVVTPFPARNSTPLAAISTTSPAHFATPPISAPVARMTPPASSASSSNKRKRAAKPAKRPSIALSIETDAVLPPQQPSKKRRLATPIASGGVVLPVADSVVVDVEAVEVQEVGLGKGEEKEKEKVVVDLEEKEKEKEVVDLEKEEEKEVVDLEAMVDWNGEKMVSWDDFVDLVSPLPPSWDDFVDLVPHAASPPPVEQTCQTQEEHLLETMSEYLGRDDDEEEESA